MLFFFFFLPLQATPLVPLLEDIALEVFPLVTPFLSRLLGAHSGKLLFHSHTHLADPPQGCKQPSQMSAAVGLPNKYMNRLNGKDIPKKKKRYSKNL